MKFKLIQVIIMLSKYALYGFFAQLFLFNIIVAENANGQKMISVKEVGINLNVENSTISKLFKEIENKTNFKFSMDKFELKSELNNRISIDEKNILVSDVLMEISKRSGVMFKQVNNNINVRKIEPSNRSVDVIEIVSNQADVDISGKISDENNEGLPGATVVQKGTTNGTTSDLDGKYKLSLPEGSVLAISFVGYETQEIVLGIESVVDVQMVLDSEQLDEIVVIGYGTQKKSDLTGSILRADIESFREQPNISLFQSLQGSVPGLNIGQVDQAGENPDISIRGTTSISGEQTPLIVLDGTIYRGSIIDINPNDILSVDVLKDASAAAVYGSQAANGVIIITSKSGRGTDKTTISYSTSFTTQSPIKEFRAGDAEDFVDQYLNGDIINSRIAPDYLTFNPDYFPSTLFKTGGMQDAYDAGLETNWFDLLTNDNSQIVNHNISIAHRNEHVSTFMSTGYTDQAGYHVGEDYKRWNARLNLENYITDWLTVGVQSFVTSSDFSGLDISRNNRYLPPVALARDANGDLTVNPGGNQTNPLRSIEQAEHTDTRLNLFGNIYTRIEIPFIEGLSYKVNYTTNYRQQNEFLFRPYGANFQGDGSKDIDISRSHSTDNILNFQRTFAQNQNVTATLLYGFEKRAGNRTIAGSSIFLNDVLGFNRLQAGQSDLQNVRTTAFEESSLYSMARLIYGYQGKYLFTGTVRRDGFSGFGTENKFGVFPSASVAWVATDESFLSDVSWLPSLKVRASYGTSGNRTLSRYQTLAEVDGSFSYVDANGNPLFGQEIISLASPSLKWETTTGLNLGVNFALFDNRITGSIDYYKNNTKDVLFNVSLPELSRFNQIPVNLGKLKNQGVDILISSVNVKKQDLTWTSTVNFSRNRDEIVELLGFDNDGDGVEDDIIADGLFIGEPIDVVFDYDAPGDLYQIGDDIPSGAEIGTFIISDLDGVDGITPDDRTIIGYESPSFRFSIQNEVRYKNWTFRVFVNSIQGGSNRYLGEDVLTSWNSVNSESVFDRVVPAGTDYWTPENTDARYQKLRINLGARGTRYTSRSFVRLQDVSLSYNVDSELLSKFNIARMKVFVSGKNLATLTGYNGWDPETGTGLERSGRPVMKSFSLGLNLEF
ncbi:MAG: TonB-linked SusC/RagA family outer membrane protein [Cyclobacteriaceae bacterium]|jgi:TonB-linked SusC/RagA family outer membrane protein